MTHQEIADSFKSFVDFLTEGECRTCNTRLTDDVLLRRIIFSRLYYALYHKYLHHDSTLAISEASGKHQTIKSIVDKTLDPEWRQAYSKLYHLRMWADYRTDENDKQATEAKVILLKHNVNRLLARSKL